MRHSIKLLGMSTNDVNEYVDTAVEANPFLKKEYEGKKSDKYKISAPPFEGMGSYYEYSDRVNAQEEDPRASLLSQLRMVNLKDNLLEIAEYLISEMDQNGYIKIPLEEVAKSLLVSIEEVENSLIAIQGLEPPGIGARDICECMQLQLKRTGKGGSLEYLIVSGFIDELVREDTAKISKALDVDQERVKSAVSNIKKLNPQPAGTMLSKSARRVIPDLIARVKNKKIQLELNKDWLPRLKLYNPYDEKLDIVKDPEAKKFLKENMDSARHLIDGLKRREETMCKVTEYILRFQGADALNDTHEIKSLTVKDVSGALGLHPSTINRTISNKYIQINDSAIPLKNFLSHGIKKENGEITSKTAIKKRILHLVKNEDRKRPLSDKAIQEKLKQEGIIIERRTIAKYRKLLRILPTYLRRKV
jgi:RNA polymerase sigma-54 factor